MTVNRIVSQMAEALDADQKIIADLRKRSKISARLAITAVPGPAVIVKKVSFRPGPDDDIDALVMIEAANFIPENMENVNLDFQVVRADGSDVEALLVAVRKDILAGFISAVEGADLDLRIVDTRGRDPFLGKHRHRARRQLLTVGGAEQSRPAPPAALRQHVRDRHKSLRTHLREDHQVLACCCEQVTLI